MSTKSVLARINSQKAVYCRLSILLLIAWAGTFLNAGKGSAPLLDAPCDNCHLAGDLTDKDNAYLLARDEPQLCEVCHPDATRASHPVGVQTNLSIPVALPLDWKNELTCSTCHITHPEAPQINHATTPGHGQLRVNTRGAAFCTYCHAQDFFDRMADGGGSLLVSGHLDGGSSLEELGVDPFSLQCMTCHDDKGDTIGAPVRVGRGNIVRHSSGNTNHPIGTDYRQAANFGGYRPIEQLAPNIELPNDQLSCISCHRGYSSNHGALITARQGSDLCFQCHDL